MFDWLTLWKGMGISKTWIITKTGAENDLCQKCTITRKEHDYKIQGHHFVEEEE